MALAGEGSRKRLVDCSAWTLRDHLYRLVRFEEKATVSESWQETVSRIVSLRWWIGECVACAKARCDLTARNKDKITQARKHEHMTAIMNTNMET